jgi:ribonuclease P protein component
MATRFLLRQHPTFFQTAEVLRTSEWTVFYAPNEQTQLTVRATKKVAATSVERHKIVRRVREAWQSALKHQSPLTGPLALVVFPTRKTLMANFTQLTTAAQQTIVAICKKYSSTST